MAEIDLDPNFRYRQAAQNTFFTGMQLGGQIADRRAAMQLRQQEMEMRQKEFNRAMGEAVIRDSMLKMDERLKNIALNEAIQEAGAQEKEIGVFMDWMGGFNNWRLNPDGNPPPPPNLKSKRFSSEINAVLQQSQDNLPFARAKRAAVAAEKIENELFAKDMERAREVLDVFGVKTFEKDANSPLGYKFNQPLLQEYSARLAREDRKLKAIGALPAGAQVEFATKMAPEEFSQVFGVPIDEVPQRQSEMRDYQNYKTAAQKNWPELEASMRASFESSQIPINEDRISEFKEAFFASGGRLPLMPTKTQEQIDNKMGVISFLDDIFADVADWEKRHKKSFAGNLGIVPTKTRELASLILRTKDPTKKEALQIVSKLAGAQNQTLTTRSGLTVTVQEGKRVIEEIGNRLDKNSMTKLLSFREAEEDRLRDILDLKTTYRMDPFTRLFMLSEPPEDKKTVDMNELHSAFRARFKSGASQPAGNPALPLINMDSIDAEMRKRGMSPNQ